MIDDVLSTMAKVTQNGQVSLPAAVRRRWGSESVLVIDCGDYAIVRPVPADPVGALRGAYARVGLSSDEGRTAERVAEAEREAARAGGRRG